MAGPKSYASATSAYTPLEVEQPHPSLALLDSTQPANRDALLSRHPHALDEMDARIDHQQNEASAKSAKKTTTNGFERENEHDFKHEHDKKVEENQRPGSGFESTIKGHPAMEGREPPEEIGGQLVEPCQSLDVPPSLSAGTLYTKLALLTPLLYLGNRATGVPRANIAATPDKPDGSQEGGWAKAHSRQSVLQQHCAWWDPVRYAL